MVTQILYGYQLHETKLNSIDNNIQYISYVTFSGEWYIQRIITDTNGQQSARYTRSDSDFLTNWNNRETLEYYPFFEFYKH